MKRVLSTLIFLLCLISAGAQELKIKSFALDANDITASSQLRNDGNGDPCALIKVQLAAPGATFDGNLVGDVAYKVNQYWVYMTSGSKHLQVNHPNYLPLDISFAEYGINSVKGKNTYVLTLALSQTNENQEQDLVIKITPQDATILIDGDIVETNKGQAKKTLSVGSHSYNATKIGYVKQMGDIKLTADAPGKLVIELDKANNATVQQTSVAAATTKKDSKSHNLDELYEKAEKLYNNDDYIQAVPILKELAENGHAKAQCNLGYCYYYGQGVSQDYSKAVEWYTKAANQKYAGAQNNLGVCYHYGQGVPQDYSKAVEWYTKAANQKYAGAQNNLGVCYAKGQGVSQDYSKAVEWYTKAANQGYALAQNNLGVCYENGQGVPQDYSKAVEWYTKAANQGHATAQYNLGACYEVGDGVKKDLQKAIELYKKAAAQGQSNAKASLERLGVSY